MERRSPKPPSRLQDHKFVWCNEPMHEIAKERIDNGTFHPGFVYHPGPSSATTDDHLIYCLRPNFGPPTPDLDACWRHPPKSGKFEGNRGGTWLNKGSASRMEPRAHRNNTGWLQILALTVPNNRSDRRKCIMGKIKL